MLLLERHRASRFAPGAFAFPGGGVEATDAWSDAERWCRGLTAAAAAGVLGDVAPPARALGFWVAALREAFEETGVLLAYGPGGVPFAPDEGGRERLRAARARVRQAGGGFAGLLASEGLTLATDRMVYYARWITPEERPIRYDARFFLAAAFDGLVAEPDGIEAVACRWLTPEHALAQHRARELALPFPTQAILRSLVGRPTVAALLEGARGREVRPVRPRVVVVDGQERVLLPGDPGYF